MPPKEEGAITAFAENLPGAAFYYEIDAQGAESIQFLNTGCEHIWSVSASEVGEDPAQLWQMVDPDDLPHLQDSVVKSAKTLSTWEARFKITDGTGRQKNLLSRGSPTALANGGVRWLTFLFDVTAETRTEKLFQLVTRQLDFVSNAIPDGFALFDPQERLVVCNAMFRAAYGAPETVDLRGMTYASILERSMEWMSFQPAAMAKDDWIEAALISFRNATGRREVPWDNGRWLRVLDRPTEDGGRVAFRIEITDAVAQKRALEKAAATDPVTGLLNRRGLALRIDEMRDRLRAHERLLVMHIDLDKFKAINDAYGHETGDKVLCEVARRLENKLAEKAWIARVGGDEFVAVRICDQPIDAAIKFAEALRVSMIVPMDCNERLCQIGATLGLATWAPDSKETIEQTLIDADTALMAGKTGGRNKTILFSPEMRAAALNSASLAAEIKAGIADAAFEPFFQPQIIYPGGGVVGLEALARWRRPGGRYASAATFIGLANETGLVRDIDRMILDQSLAVLAKLEQAGLNRPSVSINLSAMQLGTEGIVETLLDAVFEHGVSPAQVNIEVLETTLLDVRADKIGCNINQLAEAGFLIELDDFGAGHTALASLTTFPVHRIKVDRSLISGIDRDRKKRAVVSGLFLVCSKLNIEALAEGVETKEELQALQDIGFSRFQGYLFARPLPADELISWVSDWRRIAG